jgi:hypothetical protein
MARGHKTFTIFDVMEAKGVFEDNPANAVSPEFAGPVPYPKMLYHPEGKFRITVQAEMIVTPMGPKLVGEQRELIWQLVKDEEEEKKLRAQGWHDHPSKAMAAAGLQAPAESASGKIDALEAELAELRAKLATADKDKAAGAASPKSVKLA